MGTFSARSVEDEGVSLGVCNAMFGCGVFVSRTRRRRWPSYLGPVRRGRRSGRGDFQCRKGARFKKKLIIKTTFLGIYGAA